MYFGLGLARAEAAGSAEARHRQLVQLAWLYDERVIICFMFTEVAFRHLMTIVSLQCGLRLRRVDHMALAVSSHGRDGCRCKPPRVSFCLARLVCSFLISWHYPTVIIDNRRHHLGYLIYTTLHYTANAS